MEPHHNGTLKEEEKAAKKEKKEKKEKKDRARKSFLIKFFAVSSPVNHKLAESGEHVNDLVNVDSFKTPEFRKKLLSSVDDLDRLEISINQFPVEILLMIFGYIPSAELHKLCLVCSTWKAVICEIAMRTIQRFFGSSALPPDTNWARYLIESEVWLARLTRLSVASDNRNLIRWAASHGHNILLRFELNELHRKLETPALGQRVNIKRALLAAASAKRMTCVLDLMQMLTAKGEKPNHLNVIGAWVGAVTGYTEIFQLYKAGVNFNKLPDDPSLWDATKFELKLHPRNNGCWIAYLPPNAHEILRVIVEGTNLNVLSHNAAEISKHLFRKWIAKGDITSVRLLHPKLVLRMEYMPGKDLNMEVFNALIFACSPTGLDKDEFMRAIFQKYPSFAVRLLTAHNLVYPELLLDALEFRTSLRPYETSLLAYHALPPLDVRDYDGRMLVHRLCAVKTVTAPGELREWWEWLKTKMTVPEMLQLKDRSQNTPLHTACHAKIPVDYIFDDLIAVATPEDLSARNSDKETPLTLLFGTLPSILPTDRSLQLAKRLITKGADASKFRSIDFVSNSRSCSSGRHSQENPSYLEKFLDAGFPLSTFTDQAGNNLLHRFCQQDDWPCRYCFQTACQIFAAHVNDRNKAGNAPIHILAQRKRPRSKAEDLIRTGASLTSPNAAGKSALDLASSDSETKEQLQKGAADAQGACCIS